MSSRFGIDRSFKNLWENKCISVCAVSILVAAAASLGVSGASFSQDRERGLTLSASATGTYSDNYLRLSDAKLAERPSLIPEEYSLTTNAKLGWNQRIGRQQLSFNADAGYRFNKNNGNLDTESIATDAALNWKFGSKCSGSVIASYNRSLGEFETLSDITQNTISRKSASASAHCRFASRLGIVVGGGVSGSDSSALRLSVNDLKQQQAKAGFRLSLRGNDYISLMATQMWRQYDNRIVALNVTDENKQLNLGLEVQKAFGPRIMLGGWVGYSKLTNKNSPVTNFSGLSGSANISYDVGGRHIATLTARKEVDSNANLSASYVKVKGVSFSIASKWGAKMHSEFTISQNERDVALISSVVAASTFNNIYDKTQTASVSFRYDVGRLVTLSLSGRVADRNAAQNYFSYTAKSVMFGLNFRY